MEQKKHQEQGAKEQQTPNQEQLPFSEQLRQSILNQPCDLAALWGRAADSFSENKRKRRIRATIAFKTRSLLIPILTHNLCNFTKNLLWMLG